MALQKGSFLTYFASVNSLPLLGSMQMLATYMKSLLVYGFLVSGLAAVGEWSTFAFQVYYLGWHYIPASVFSFLIGTAINAALSRSLAFRSKGRTGVQEVAFIYAASILAFLVNLGVLSFFVEILRLSPMLGKVAGTGVAFFINFGLRQFVIFSSMPKWK